MRNKINRLLLMSLIASIISVIPNPQPAFATLEVKETQLISSYLEENFRSIKEIYRYANEMKKQAMPFNSKKHRDRYRFEPRDTYARTIMSKTRSMVSRYRVVNGILCISAVQNRNQIYKETMESLDSIVVYSKRAIRAVKDNNYALYLASAEGIEKEAVNLNNLLDELEENINETIDEADSLKESL